MSSADPNNPPSDNPPSINYNPPKAQSRASSLSETLRRLFQQYKKVLCHPGASTFVNELPNASWDSILTQVLLMSVVEAAILFIDQLLNIQTILPHILFIQSFALPIILGCNLGIFFLWAGLTYTVSRWFEGVGTFKDYCYGYALLLVPVSITSSLLSFVPGIGAQLSTIPIIYSFVLQVLMIMGIQRLSTSKSVVTMLLSSFILIVLGVLLAIIVSQNIAINTRW